jgi:hypothetical protein
MAGSPGHVEDRNVSGEGECVLSRRTFLGRGLSVAGLAALSQVPLALAPKGLLGQADAFDLGLARDTFSGLAAFVLPGDDRYSVAQGVMAAGPGAVGAGAVGPLIATLDRFVAASAIGADRVTVPVSSAVALLLDDFALQVNPVGLRGGFLSPLARLSFAEKGRALRLLDEDRVIGDLIGETRYLSGLLVPLLAFLAISEAPGFDPVTRALRGTPVGWQMSDYNGPARGHAEFRGYFQGRQWVRG